MNKVLTPERVMEIREEWKRIFLKNLSPKDLDAYLNPEYKRALLTAGREEGREEGRIRLVQDPGTNLTTPVGRSSGNCQRGPAPMHTG
ncbi:MAG: hypothetical protein R3C14_25215 [Caldilineaceae bacterium]